jgi:hypothetical protein
MQEKILPAGFWLKDVNERERLEQLGVDARIILK